MLARGRRIREDYDLDTASGNVMRDFFLIFLFRNRTSETIEDARNSIGMKVSKRARVWKREGGKKKSTYEIWAPTTYTFWFIYAFFFFFYSRVFAQLSDAGLYEKMNDCRIRYNMCTNSRKDVVSLKWFFCEGARELYRNNRSLHMFNSLFFLSFSSLLLLFFCSLFISQKEICAMPTRLNDVWNSGEIPPFSWRVSRENYFSYILFSERWCTTV